MTARHRPATPTVGFVSPPRWATPSTVEFPAVAAAPVLPQQCIPDLPDFGYSLDDIAAAGPAVDAAAALLGEAGCWVVGMEGTPFAWAGCCDETSSRARVARMAEAAGVPAASAGTAIVDALRALGAERVALCPAYYQPDWRDAWRRFVATCGFDVASCRNMADEGITGPIADGDAYGWDTGPELVRAAVEAAAARVADADAVVVTGAGCRTTPIITELEAAARCPVVGADSALYWAVAALAGITLRPGSLGALTEVPLR